MAGAIDLRALIPAIETARLRLRPLRPEDAPALQALTDDPAITGAIPFLAAPFTLAEAAALIARNGSGHECFFGAWRRDPFLPLTRGLDPRVPKAGAAAPVAIAGSSPAMTAKEEDDAGVVGVVGAHLQAPDAIEIGYWMATAVTGTGYATEAASALVAAVHGALPDRLIFAECRPENRASWRVLEKLGFRATGRPGARPGRAQLVLDPAALPR